MAGGDRVGFGDHGKDEAVALVGNAGGLFGGSGVGVLHVAGLAGDERVGAVVDCVSPGVAEAEVEAVVEAPLQRDGETVVLTGGFRFKLIDGIQLRNGPRQGIDAWGDGAGEALRELLWRTLSWL